MPAPQGADGARAGFAFPAAQTPAAVAAPGAVAHTPAAVPAAPRRAPRYLLPLAVLLQTLISAGDGLGMVALASRVFQGSHASWAVAAVFLAITVPVTVLAPLVGVLLDRLRPRPVLTASAAAQALLAVAMAQVSGAAAILALAVGFGVCAAVLQPGLGSIVPQLAGPAGVTRANGYLQAATWGGFTLGPLLAGLLMAMGGTGTALAAVAVLYAAGAVALRALPLNRTGAHPRGGPAEPFRRQLSAGLRFLRADRQAGLLVAVTGLMDAFGNMAVVVEVVYAERVLHSGPTGYAVLVSGWTAGMLAGTLVGGRVPRRRLVAVTLACTLAAGVGVALAGAAAALWQAVAAYAFGGLANGMETVTTRSFLNYRAPAAIAGRVFALYSGVLFGAASVGMAVAGGVLSSLNPRLVLLLAGAGSVLAGAAGLLRHARLRLVS